MQNKYYLEDAKTEPMFSIVTNDNWVEFTLRFVVRNNKKISIKTELFSKILKEIEETDGEIKFTSATFHLVDASFNNFFIIIILVGFSYTSFKIT